MGSRIEDDEIPFDPDNPPPKEPHRVKTFEDAMKEMKATAAEEQVLNNGGDFEDLPERQQAETLEEAANRDPNAVPEWIKIPPSLKIPEGKEVQFVRFLAKWTDKPHLGERQCILWSLSSADEKLAMKRTRGDSMAALQEATKQSIRVIDGAKADWTGRFGLGNVDTFWNDIGPKCRNALAAIYHKTHHLEALEQLHFFTNCFVARRVAGS